MSSVVEHAQLSAYPDRVVEVGERGGGCSSNGTLASC